ncbi:unnamed protein product, partial [Acanthocheilonema viteae]
TIVKQDCWQFGYLRLMAITQHLSHVMQQLMGSEIVQMGSNQPSGVSSTNSKHKEVYKYEAPHTLYATGWSQHPDSSKKFRLALASFIEEYNNKISIVKLDEDAGEFIDYGSFDHPYPATKVMWIPDQ